MVNADVVHISKKKLREYLYEAEDELAGIVSTAR